jgi:hypothetical protein
MIRNPERLIVVLAAGVAAAACGLRGHQPVSDSSLLLPGTYAVSICPTPCSPVRAESAAVVGHLVLEMTPYTAAEVEAVQRTYGARGAFLYRAAGGEPNACFGLTRVRRGRSYAGLRVAGLTRWRRSDDGDGFTIELYCTVLPTRGTSPRSRHTDASCTATASRRAAATRPSP